MLLLFFNGNSPIIVVVTNRVVGVAAQNATPRANLTFTGPTATLAPAAVPIGTISY